MKRREYRVDGLPEPVSHYTDAVHAGDLLFVSGIVPVDADGEDVAGHGLCSMPCDESSPRRVRPADIVKVTVFLTDVNDRTAINRVREEFFGDARPASTLVEISGLAIPGAKIEVEAVAMVRA